MTRGPSLPLQLPKKLRSLLSLLKKSTSTLHNQSDEPLNPQLLLAVFAALATITLLSLTLPPSPLNIRRRLSALRGRIYLWFLINSYTPPSSPKLTVKSLHTYPLKSAQSLSHTTHSLSKYGLANDRILMIARAASNPTAPLRFFTQRQSGALATIACTPTNAGYYISSSLLPSVTQPLFVQYPPTTTLESRDCVVWDDTLSLLDFGDAACEYCDAALVNTCFSPMRVPLTAAYITKIVSLFSPATNFGPLRLVCMPPCDPNYTRTANPIYFPPSALTLAGTPPPSSLSDGFPILITGTASLADLNSRLKTPILMNRFRPNIVVNTTVPFEEDSWRVVLVNGVIYSVLKGCPRCKQSCTDQLTGKLHEEPEATLQSYRRMSTRHPEDVFFGQNVATKGEGGTVSVGDEVRVLRWEEGFVADKGDIQAA